MLPRRNPEQPSRGWGRVVRWSLLALHALLVLPVVVLWLTAAVPAMRDSPDANIGAGLIGLYLLAVGLPWTLLLLFVDLDSLGTPVRDAVVAVLPLLNLALHAFLTLKPVAGPRPGRPKDG